MRYDWQTHHVLWGIDEIITRAVAWGWMVAAAEADPELKKEAVCIMGNSNYSIHVWPGFFDDASGYKFGDLTLRDAVMEMTKKTGRKGFWGWLRSMFSDEDEKARRKQEWKEFCRQFWREADEYCLKKYGCTMHERIEQNRKYAMEHPDEQPIL